MAEAATESADAEIETTVTPFADQIADVSAWVPEPLQPLWTFLGDFPIVLGISIAALFWLFAFLIRAVVLNNLERLSSRSTSTVDDAVIGHLKRPIFTTIFLFGVILGIQAAQLPFGRGVLINLVASVIVVSWIRAGLNMSTDVLSAAGRNPRFQMVEDRTIPLFDLTIKLLILLVASYVLLLIWGINPVGWLASAGIVGIAVGFAAKDTLANLFSGFFILADSPYKIGDYINLDSGERGQVVSIGMRSTRLLTRDDVEITVPNAVIANAKITNESGGPNEKMRLRIAVGVAYGADVAEVCEVLEKVAVESTDVSASPTPRVRMRAFGASSLDFELLAWIDKPEDRGRVSHELYMAVYNALNAANIEIPFTKQDVYIKEMPYSTKETPAS